ncbi:putative DNA binding protein [Klebsiella pneumoniae]|nr:putative DNA binding protein [Klebsiella pneumoniae]
MLDTGICVLILREQPAALLKRLERAVLDGDRVVAQVMAGSQDLPLSSWRIYSLPASMPPALGQRRGGRHHGR